MFLITSTNQQRFPTNPHPKGRDFVVGDIHGCYDLVMKLKKQVKFNPVKDRMFSCGDLINKGPDSVKCLELIKEPWFHAVRGNHEQMFIDAILGKKKKSLLSWMKRFGGMWAKDVEFEKLKELAELADTLPYIIVVGEEEERYNICHGEMLRTNRPFSDKTIDKWKIGTRTMQRLLWGRSIIKEKNTKKRKEPIHKKLSLTYVGHSPAKEVRQVEQHIYLDTGAFINAVHSNPVNKLTMINVFTGELVSAQI